VIHGLELDKIGSLNFMKPHCECFPCLSYAYKALETGGTMPSVLNAANEVAVNAFLNGGIKFTDIPQVIKNTMEHHKVMHGIKLDAVMRADRWARKKAKEIMRSFI
jgi:1-deoxy-D-xylulose-5-phosphate reductoisomerase